VVEAIDGIIFVAVVVATNYVIVVSREKGDFLIKLACFV